jgi:hypothetical protein
MVNKALRWPPEICGWFSFAPRRFVVTRRRNVARGVVDPVRLGGSRALRTTIGPEGVRRRPTRALGFVRLGKSVHRLSDAPWDSVGLEGVRRLLCRLDVRALHAI